MFGQCSLTKGEDKLYCWISIDIVHLPTETSVRVQSWGQLDFKIFKSSSKFEFFRDIFVVAWIELCRQIKYYDVPDPKSKIRVPFGGPASCLTASWISWPCWLLQDVGYLHVPIAKRIGEKVHSYQQGLDWFKTAQHWFLLLVEQLETCICGHESDSNDIFWNSVPNNSNRHWGLQAAWIHLFGYWNGLLRLIFFYGVLTSKLSILIDTVSTLLSWLLQIVQLVLSSGHSL